MEIVTFVLLLVAYLLPAIVAQSRGHRNFGAITTLNILTGWTGFGWIGALVWAMSDNVEVVK